jgi:hypothetical protein
MNTGPGDTEANKALDRILERLRQGDLSAMRLVTRENVIPLLAKAKGDPKIEKLLAERL